MSTRGRDLCIEVVESVCKELGIVFNVEYLAGIDEVERVLNASLKDASDPDYNMVEWFVRRVVDNLLNDPTCGRLYIALGAAGRRLTASLVLALLSSLARRVRRHEDVGELLRKVSIVHTEFYFSEWIGLSYPYTPRRLEPVVVLYPVPHNIPSGRHLDRVPQALNRSIEKLSPLRRSVAGIAKNINVLDNGRVLAPGMRKCSVLRICISSSEVCYEANLCMEDEVAELLDNTMNNMPGCVDEVKAMLGLRYPLRISRKMLIDTSLIYRGIHLEAVANPGMVIVPQCAIAEITRRAAESLKRTGNIIDILSYLALRDMIRVSMVVPTPPPPCDTAIPCIDPLLATNLTLATVDKGAYRLWRAHPVAKIAEIMDAGLVDHATNPITAKELVSGARCDEGVHLCDYQKLIARLYYALYQTLVYIALLQELSSRNIVISPDMRRIMFRISIVDTERREKLLQPSIKPILRDLGLE